MSQDNMMHIDEISIRKEGRSKKMLIFILKVLLLFAMPIIVSIIDHFFM